MSGYSFPEPWELEMRRTARQETEEQKFEKIRAIIGKCANCDDEIENEYFSLDNIILCPICYNNALMQSIRNNIDEGDFE